ncbi:unnamed protein product [Euphydryas editha]|uniref:Retrovirus-related Pol polyprotein from transposon TNT 1-94 n=1 Tax=Euphydryas editha TaxID=104508 RepID=A0AAU9V0I8_EUPED|nr:unnamed protein product [Euphydryas editha]
MAGSYITNVPKLKGRENYDEEFKAMVERQTGKCIKVLRTDNGGEFCSSEMECFLKKNGIVHQKTNPYTPEQNENTKGYRLYNPVTKKILTSRDVVIIEASKDSEMVQAVVENKEEEVTEKEEEESDRPAEMDQNLTTNDSEVTAENPKDETYIPSEEERSDISTSSSNFEECTSEIEDIKYPEPVSKLGKRMKKPPQRYGFSNVCMIEDEDIGNECLTYENVMNDTEREEWCKAMEDELQSFRDNDAWDLVDKPSDARVVQCKWVFKRKLNSDNTVRYRARLVAKGYTQKQGIDYKETFSPVLRYSSLKLLFAISVNLDLNITHLDVTTAFLNGQLNECVYMQLPNNLKNERNVGKVLKLKKAIYGLKQSARAWYKKVENCLQELGYKKSLYESCLFVKVSEKEKTFIALFVDDFFIFSNCNREVDYLKAQLNSKFKLKDLGQLRQCLGMDVVIEKGKLCINQTKFIEKLLCKFNMQNCNGIETPMELPLYASLGALQF